MIKKIYSFLVFIICAITLSSCDGVTGKLQNENKHTVTYKSEIGTFPDAITVPDEYALLDDNLPDISFDDNKFVGWFIGTKQILPGYVVRTSITLVAKWEKTANKDNQEQTPQEQTPQEQETNEVKYIPVSYSIGDVYPIIGEPEGVVVEVDKTTSTIKILSLDQETCLYADVYTKACSSDYGFALATQSTTTDGETNWEIFKSIVPDADGNSRYGAWFWCKNTKGLDWYIPAKNELVNIINNATVINNTITSLRSKGYDATSFTTNKTWSSTPRAFNSSDNPPRLAMWITASASMISNENRYYARALKKVQISSDDKIEAVSICYKIDDTTDYLTTDCYKGAVPKPPKAPKKDGYIFDGWYMGESRYTFDKAIEENVELTAHWTILSSPENLKVTGSTRTSVSLEWDSVEGVSTYHVYYNTSSSMPETYVTVSENKYTVQKLQEDTLYYFGVTSYKNETESKISSLDFSYTPIDLPIKTGSCGDSLNYEIYADGRMIISGTGEMPGDCRELNTIWQKYTINKVSVMEGVTSIGEQAFYGFANLSEIELPDTLVKTGCNIITNCPKLTRVTVPKNVSSIDTLPNSFYNLNLSEIIVDEENQYYASYEGCLYSKDFSELLLVPAQKTLIPFHSNTQKIGRYSCICAKVTSVTLPSTVTSIEDKAFAECTNLTEFNMTDNVTTIGFGLFDGCTSLKKVRLSSRLTELSSTFQNCKSLATVTIPSSVTELYGTFFGCSSLTSITIPSSVSRIVEGAFANCTRLSTIYIPNKAVYIGAFTFQSWTSSQKIRFACASSLNKNWEACWNYSCSASMSYNQ